MNHIMSIIENMKRRGEDEEVEDREDREDVDNVVETYGLAVNYP